MKRLFAWMLAAALLLTLPALAQWPPEGLEKGPLSLVPADFSVFLSADALQTEAERYNTALTDAGEQEDLYDMQPFEGGAVQEQEIPAEAVYETASFLSFSPDGSSFFMVSAGVPAVYRFDTRKLTLIAPQGKIENEKARAYAHRALRQPNAQGIQWSPDGKWMAFTDPEAVLMFLQPGANILLVDVEQGTVRPLAPPVPDDVTLFSGEHPGLALGGIFSQNSAALYYEMFGVSMGEERTTQLRAYDLATGEDRLLRLLPYELATTSATRFWSGNSIVSFIADIKADGPAGIQLVDPEGDYRQVTISGQERADRTLMGGALADVSGQQALLYTEPGYNGMVGVSLVDLAKTDGADLSSLLAIDAQAEGPKLLRKPYPEASREDGLLYPTNGAFSPDGSSLLLRAGLAPEEASFFLYDLREEQLQAVDLSQLEAGEFSFLGSIRAPQVRIARGIQWLADGRLVINNGGQPRLYELKVGQ